MEENLKYLEDSESFLKLFGSLKTHGFTDPVFLSDTKVGFSIRKRYPQDIRYKPAQNKTGDDDNVACIWAVYDQSRKKETEVIVPIRLRIATMSLYRSKYWFDEDDDAPEKPTSESLAISRDSPQPIELSLTGYFYDASNGYLVDEHKKKVLGYKILEELFQAHCNSVHPILGLKRQAQTAVHKISRQSLDYLVDTIKFLLKQVFGRTLVEPLTRSAYYEGYRFEDLGKLDDDSVDLFGYKITKRILFLFITLFVISTYSLFPFKQKSYFELLTQSDGLLTIHVFAALLVLDELIPRLLFIKMNLIIRLRKYYIDKQIQKSI